MSHAAVRLRLGLTQTQLAALLGVHPMTVSRWERGTLRPSPHQRRILAALDSKGNPDRAGAHVERLLGMLNAVLIDVSEIGDMKLSASNQLRGRIVEIEYGPVSTRVVIEIAPKVRIVSVITTASAHRLKLALKKKVVAIIKATEVIVGTD